MNINLYNDSGFSKIYVVFTDNTSLWWLRLLKPGFRHCYVLLELEANNTWLELNPYSNQLIIKTYQQHFKFNFIQYLQKKLASHILEFEISPAPLHCAPLSAFTCVEFVKRILGIHDVLVLTPYQLYKKIINCRKKVLTF